MKLGCFMTRAGPRYGLVVGDHWPGCRVDFVARYPHLRDVMG